MVNHQQSDTSTAIIISILVEQKKTHTNEQRVSLLSNYSSIDEYGGSGDGGGGGSQP